MTPTMPPDSHKISLKIIEAIRQHPVLYISDVKGTTLKVQEFRQKVWKRISDDLSLDPVWVRLKWKNLRDTYSRVLKLKSISNNASRRKKWIFEDHLNFLKFPYEADYQPQCVELSEEYIQEINEGGLSSEDLLEQLEDRNEDDYNEYLEVLEETSADPVVDETPMDISLIDEPQQSRIADRVSDTEDSLITQNNDDNDHQNIDNSVQQIQSKYRKIRPKRMKIDKPTIANNLSRNYSLLKNSGFNLLQKADKKYSNDSNDMQPITITATHPIKNSLPSTKISNNSLQNETEISVNRDVLHGQTSIELFFNSMAQTVKLLPLKAQVEIKMAVCRIVTAAEVRNSKILDKSKNTQQFITPPGMIPKLVLVPCSMIDKPRSKD